MLRTTIERIQARNSSVGRAIDCSGHNYQSVPGSIPGCENNFLTPLPILTYVLLMFYSDPKYDIIACYGMVFTVPYRNILNAPGVCTMKSI